MLLLQLAIAAIVAIIAIRCLRAAVAVVVAVVVAVPLRLVAAWSDLSPVRGRGPARRQRRREVHLARRAATSRARILRQKMARRARAGAPAQSGHLLALNEIRRQRRVSEGRSACLSNRQRAIIASLSSIDEEREAAERAVGQKFRALVLRSERRRRLATLRASRIAEMDRAPALRLRISGTEEWGFGPAPRPPRVTRLSSAERRRKAEAQRWNRVGDGRRPAPRPEVVATSPLPGGGDLLPIWAVRKAEAAWAHKAWAEAESQGRNPAVWGVAA